jgi:chemotaxis protein methyltransferase CheR
MTSTNQAAVEQTMSDADCTAFLQWALPKRELRWPGFRKVRRQVCKRLKWRIRDLGLDNYAAYRVRLETDATEWPVFDDCCHITISRFFRDRSLFEVLRTRVLPDIGARARRERRTAQVWSAGCASGEEAYTIRVLWDLEVARLCPGASLSVLASDVDKVMLSRAGEGCFAPGSLRELPRLLIDQAFTPSGVQYCVKPEHREGIEFFHQDLRTEMPSEAFDLVLCRNVAFTYFVAPLQQRVLKGILARLQSQGYLMIGAHERLPDELPGLIPLVGARQIFQKRERPGGS